MRHRLFDVQKFTEVDIHMDYFKKAEEKLYSVCTLRRRLDNYEAAYDREVRRSAPSGIKPIDYSKPTVSSSRSDDALDSVEKMAYYKTKVIQTRDEIEDITTVAEQLPTELYNIIRLWYFEKKPKEKIMASLYISSPKTLYAKRRKAVKMFAEIFPW